MSDNPSCVEKCRTPVECLVCRRRKKPCGRDVGAAAANGFCDRDCEGYEQEPIAPHLWPSELIGDEKEPTDGEEEVKSP